jgi:hypothetical protein
MCVYWIAVLALCASPPDQPASTSPSAPSTSAAETAVAPPRSAHELQQAVRDTLRRWTRSSDKDAGTAARELIALYKELDQDQLLGASQRQELRTKVRNRLAQLAVQISKRLARQARQDASGPKSVRLDKDATVLNQMGGFMQPGGAAPGGMMGPGGGGNNANANFDYGDDLVSLIQTTIAPKSWEVNGGLGTIYYWRGQRYLVVRNTSEVHEQLADLLDQLNRAGH